jgi:uncharacterized membrane protein YfcA
MLPILTALAGAVSGALAARRRKGSNLDIAQWAAVWAIIGGLIGFVALIVLTRF